jgi:hypothetical protein
VAPTTSDGFEAANHALEAYPRAAHPALGSLVGTGFYEARLAYDLAAAGTSGQKALFGSFGGLLHVSAAVGPPTPVPALPAWESGLWSGGYDRNSVLGAWGHRSNVVVTDGVEQAGFVAHVVELNAR